MKLETRKKTAKNWTRILSLFFLLYALSDVSVLQVYCGNEALGIPPDHHISDSGHHASETRDAPCKAGQSSCKNIPNDHDYDHQHQCFCWQQATVPYYSFELSSAAKIAAEPPTVFHEVRHTNSAISYLFRPPKTA
jgi:hypothetical protein